MKKITSVFPRTGLGAGGPALAGTMALVAAGCASGGGGPPLAGVAAEALFADLSGVWVLNESTSAPPLADLPEVRSFEIIRGGPGQNRESAALVSNLSVTDAAYEVLRQRPDTLRLRVDEAGVAYAPSPGDSIMVPMDGGSVLYRLRRHTVRTRVVWDDYNLALSHRADGRADVHELLQIVGGRLRMTRTVRGAGTALVPVVLVYDREG